MRDEASDAERPWVTDVWSFCAVSCDESSEYADVIDCTQNCQSCSSSDCGAMFNGNRYHRVPKAPSPSAAQAGAVAAKARRRAKTCYVRLWHGT